ncbi:CaiB/BaiF CoA transferase family protein [Nocardia aobensis]|uniref:CaiB/BaiF CoA transferase family protein n=1 Tax=Nocardia aobensis TaxID=257277 RepID=A0ABW6P9D7_9NOCA
MVSLFEGLRVVDLTEGMLSVTAAVLADFGADVVKVEPPGGDSARGKQGFRFWNRGKRSLVLDLTTDTGRAELHALVAEADVLVESLGPEATGYGLAPELTTARNPRLVHCGITGFGEAAEFERFGRSEQMVTAKVGRLMGNDLLSGAHGDLDRPLYLASPASTYGAAMLAVQAIVAALLQRERTGRGRSVSTSLLDGISAATMRLAFERRGEEVVPVAARGADSVLLLRGIRLCFLTVETGDGRHIQMCCRQPRLYRNWMNAIGLGDELEQPRWAGLPLGVQSLEDAQEWEARVRDRMLERTQEEWMDMFRTLDIGADPFLTEEEFLRHPQLIANDRVVTVEDPEVGPILQLGPLVTADRTPGRIVSSAPALDSASPWSGWEPATRADTSAGEGESAGLPLQGYTILEIASFLAAPLGPTLLAELGARVIKVEPLDGDPFRSSGLEFVHIGNGKESVALDLKSPEGKQVLHRLIEQSDALIHNFRPGVPEKLGFGYEQARAIRPDLVYLYGASYGSKGPEAHRAAFHSTPNALCGGGIAQAGKGNPPVNDSYADPCSGLATGVALALGLYARDRHGIGQYLETSMLVSAGWVHSARMESYEGRPARLELTTEQTGFSALDRLYQCAEGWVMLASGDDEWPRLVNLLGKPEWLDDERFAEPDGRAAHDRVLQWLLEDVFVTRTAAEWEAAAVEQRVPIVSAADHTLEHFLVHAGLVDSAEHPAFGTYWRLKPRVRVAGAEPVEGLPCELGEHTEPVLRSLGYTDAEIERLEREGVARSAPPERRHPGGIGAGSQPLAVRDAAVSHAG